MFQTIGAHRHPAHPGFRLAEMFRGRLQVLLRRDLARRRRKVFKCAQPWFLVEGQLAGTSGRGGRGRDKRTRGRSAAPMTRAPAPARAARNDGNPGTPRGPDASAVAAGGREGGMTSA